MNEQLLRNVLNTIKNKPEFAPAIIDSFSDNQFISKNSLLDIVYNNDVLSDEKSVVILGSWFGSILVPKLADKVKSITCIDLDEDVLRTAKNRLFPHINNVEWRCSDVFDCNKLDLYRESTLFINTSCEHMKPMKDWILWEWIVKKNSPFFIFQSNNMDWISDHINCVYSLEEFKSQLPKCATVIEANEICDSRGTRFTLFGKMESTV